MKFGQLLKQYINDSEISVRLFSKITDLNRGWLYNIFSDKKKLSEDKFHKMLDYFPFSDAQKEKLREAYYEDLYGTDNFKKIQFIISELKSLKEHNDSDYTFSNYTQIYNFKLNFINDKYNLFDSVLYLLRTSVLKKDALVYSNFSYEQEEIDSIMYSCISKNDNVHFFHIINFDNIGSDIHNLRNVFRSIKYAKHNINSYFYYDNKDSIKLDNIFSFFIITTTGILLYNDTLDNGLLILENSIINNFLQKADNILKKCIPLISFPSDASLLKDCLAQSTYLTHTASICSEPCLATYLTLEMLESITDQNIPGRQFVINSFYEWIQSTDNPGDLLVHLNTTHGFSRFAQTGYITYLPTEYSKPLSQKHRIEILKKGLESTQQKHSFYLIDDNRITLPDNIIIELLNPHTVLIYGYWDKTVTPQGRDFVIFLSNNMILSDLNNFKDYILRNKFYLNEKYSQLFFNDLIRRLESPDSFT